MANHAQAQLPLPILPDSEPSPYVDASGRLYTEAQIRKAKLEKYPAIKAWLREHRSVFDWLRRAFIDLAPIAEDGSVSGNTLIYHLRFTGIANGKGGRTRLTVSVSNDVNPVLARMLALLYPDMKDKLSTSACVWDTPALQPCIQELATMLA